MNGNRLTEMEFSQGTCLICDYGDFIFGSIVRRYVVCDSPAESHEDFVPAYKSNSRDDKTFPRLLEQDLCVLDDFGQLWPRCQFDTSVRGEVMTDG
jgi:hypothetical protein